MFHEVIGHDVGQKSEAAAIDAQQRHVVPRDQPRGIEERAVAADGDDKVRAPAQARPSARARSSGGAAAGRRLSSLTSTSICRDFRCGTRMLSGSATSGSAKRPTSAQLRTGKAIQRPCRTSRSGEGGVFVTRAPRAANRTIRRERRQLCLTLGTRLDSFSQTWCNDARDDAPSERAQQLLRTLIESYIRDGQPVGSRVLSRESGLQLSSATIRNVMADLEEWGFVTSPHTSAGRIPTDKGYRFFVDTLLQVKPLDGAAVIEIRRQLDGRPTTAPRHSSRPPRNCFPASRTWQAS